VNSLTSAGKGVIHQSSWEKYSDEQLRAIEFADGHLQIIACAGSGKTETVARKCAVLLKRGIKPQEIVAFTFTERAAEELRSRIERNVSEICGTQFLHHLNTMFVGTIHSFCFRILRENMPQFSLYDALDQHKLAGFLSREYDQLGLDTLGVGKQWQTIGVFLDNVEVVENELLTLEELGQNSFRDCYERLCDELQSFRLLTFGQMIALAVHALAEPNFRNKVFGGLKYLIVDEYQDINPAQEALIGLMAGNETRLTVVGDDLQAIYQWRGSDVRNILTFAKRFNKVHSETLTTNYRSRPNIIHAAENFSNTISPKLSKQMKPCRPSSEPEVVCWKSDDPHSEARTIAETIKALVENGYHYKDCAILLRSVRTSSEPFIRIFEEKGIPYHCGGRTGLFHQPEAQLLGQTYAWLVDCDWQESRLHSPARASIDELLQKYAHQFDLSEGTLRDLRTFLMHWKADISGGEQVDLVQDFYGLLEQLKLYEYGTDDLVHIAKLGTMARFSQLLVDFESMARRGYIDKKREFVSSHGATGKWMHKQLYLYMQYYALEAYEGFAGEKRLDIDAVEINTVHQAKGLEWPIVFVPCLVSTRFPSRMTGTKRKWLVPERLFDHVRYEGTEMDERRLFYVAITRAKDMLYASCFSRINRPVSPSRFLTDFNNGKEIERMTSLPIPHAELATLGRLREEKVRLTFSQLALYEFCPYAFRLRQLLGFEPPMAFELGYGKAIHRIMQVISDYVKESGKIPDEKAIQKMFKEEFYVPYANKFLLERLKNAAMKIVSSYIKDFGDELRSIWQTERSFELHLQEGTVYGRADAIINTDSKEKEPSLAIIDYKTSLGAEDVDTYALQLRIYAMAGRKEGLKVETAYIHDLKKGERVPISLEEADTQRAEQRTNKLINDLCSGRFSAIVGVHCKKCDVRWVCEEGRSSRSRVN
jgi:DNA helicase-2/ATP-dependent DNA helicase PcrA